MYVVAKLVPDSDSPSNLPRAPENLRICPHCEQLVGRDLSDCPYCRRRLPALGDPQAQLDHVLRRFAIIAIAAVVTGLVVGAS